MGTLNSLLNLATAGLQADQIALNVTANNVANQNTAGYTRQVVSFNDGDYVTLQSGQLESASGPAVTVTSARDLVLERQVQAAQQAYSSSSSLSSVYSEIQSVFGLTDTGSSAGSTQIGTALDGLFSSLTALTSNPSDAATRQGVLSAAGTVTGVLNSAANQLTELASNVDAQAVSTVDQINALSQTVATLNDQISSQSPTTDAGTLEDQRQTAIAQLSQYVGLNQTTSANNSIQLTTTSGASLVVGGQAWKLTTGSVAGSTHIFDANGTDVTAGLTGGSLGGLLQGIGTAIPQVSSALDTLAYSLGSAFNTQNEAGLDAYGSAGQALFQLPASVAGSASSIAVLPTDAGLIAAAGTGQGSVGSTNAQALVALAQATTTSGQSFDAYYASLISEVGTNAATVSSQNTAQQANLNQLQTQRDSYSAVDLNEEAANLTTYQRSYQAAAKVFSIADSIFADAINLGVQTSVQ